ncbi:MAG: FadR family transcriptional regulator [Rhodospirillales bacterium]|nr:FadR family transcriptional regulator [Rhodospirillales bacterium]
MRGNVAFRPIVAQRLYQQVAEQIAALIRDGAFAPGARLPPERDLAQQFGVSRPTVREAMIALEIAGLIDIRSGSGVYVASGSGVYVALPDAAAAKTLPALGDAGPSLFDILAARRTVECEIAALAAAQPDPDALAALERLIAAQDAAMKRGQADGRVGGHAEDRAFHLAIAAMAGNEVLTGFAAALWDTMFTPVYARLAERTEGPRKTRSTIADHRAILAALARADAAGARRAMRAHIAHTEALFLGDPKPPEKAAP